MPKIDRPPMSQHAIRFPPPLIERIDTVAQAQGIGRAEFVRLACIQKLRESDRSDASESDA